MRAELIATAVALAGCGRLGFSATEDAGDSDAKPPLIEPPPSYVGGTRLTPVLYRSGDASRFEAWHDTLLDTDCQFTPDEMGRLRCLPVLPAISSSYKDAACTEQLALVAPEQSNCGNALTYAADLNTGRVAATGIEYVGTVWQRSGATCFDTMGLVTARTFAIGSAVPPSMFVGASEVMTQSGDYSYIEYVADDGARERRNLLYDHRRDERCTLEVVGRDRAFCAPRNLIASGTREFRDAACTQPVVVTESTKPYVRIEGETLCDAGERIVERGTPYSGPVYKLENGCVVDGSGVPAYELGADHLADFAVLTRTMLAGISRLRNTSWRTSDGVEMDDTEFWDTARNGACVPEVVQDGSTRCTPPVEDHFPVLFTDPSCTMSLGLSTAACRKSNVAFYYPVVSGVHATCDGYALRYKAFDIAVPTVYEHTDQACVPVTGTDVFTTNAGDLDPDLLAPVAKVRL